MPKSQPKIALSVSGDIPFNRLVLSQANVRRIKAGVGIDELAEDIARRTLLQSLTVRPVIDEAGTETGVFEVPSGGRRYRALELLVKKKRLSRTAPVPCIVRIAGDPVEDSLAENVQRAPLHPLDQFRAFLSLREKGKSEEDIAAAFFVSANVVRQRLRLASVSPVLLDIYAEDGMTLEQLMAFTVNPDHARQEQVWETVQRSQPQEPYRIRRLLTEEAVRASDKRARFAGIEAYEAAGGIILRDLFEADQGGWLQDPGLLDRLVAERLEREAETVRAEGWKWVEVSPEFPYGTSYDLRRLSGTEVPLTDDERSARDALKAEFDRLEETYAESNEVPEDVDRRLDEIETALEAFEQRPVVYEEAEIARAGAFVSIDASGALRIERGYVRPEDEPPVTLTEDVDSSEATAASNTAASPPLSVVTKAEVEEADEDDGVRTLSDRLMSELTAHRTLALRDALANDPDVAFLATLHVLALKLFYRYGLDSCLEIEPKSVMFGGQASGLGDTASAKSMDARQATWAAQLPKEPSELWDWLLGLDADSRQALFAHCVALTINAAYQPYNRRPKALAHADRLAEAVALDVAAAGWRATIDSYLGRVTKARILDAVREAKGEAAAQGIDHLKKAEMASAAEALLADTGWLPEPLRTPGQGFSAIGATRGVDDPEPSADEMNEAWETAPTAPSPHAAAE